MVTFAAEERMGSLVKFFAVTYAIAWTAFAAAATLSDTATPPVVRELLFLPGAFAPGIVALWLTWRTEGRGGTTALLGRVAHWRVDPRWYVFAIGYVAVVKLTAAVVYRGIPDTWPRFGGEAWYILLGATILSTPFQAGEELGWRGYALPRLSARFGRAPASILLGVIWAVWHLPLFFLPGTTTTGQSFPLYLLQVTALSVAIAWLYWQTNGSLLLTMLLHAAINNTKDIVPSAIAGAADPFSLSASNLAWLTVAVLWVSAAYFLLHMAKKPLSAPVV
jgi:membrane protease YdiL (CAAX protease family)